MTKQITEEEKVKIFALESKFIEATEKDDYLEVINLINQGLPIEASMKSCLWNPISPLIHAVHKNAIKIAYILLCNGASPEREYAGKTAIDATKSSNRKTMYDLLFSVDLADQAAHSPEEFNLQGFLKKLPKKHNVVYEVIKSRMEGWIKHYSMNKHLSKNFETIKDGMTQLVLDAKHTEVQGETTPSKVFPIYSIDTKPQQELSSLKEPMSLSGDIKYCVEAY